MSNVNKRQWAERVKMFLIGKLAGKSEVVMNHVCPEKVREVIKEIEVIREVPQDKIVWVRRRRR